MKFIPHDFSQKIVIDEIQRVPELLNDVYRLIEQKNNQLILINSSARKLRAKGVNLLAGRTPTQLPALLLLKEAEIEMDPVKSGIQSVINWIN